MAFGLTTQIEHHLFPGVGALPSCCCSYVEGNLLSICLNVRETVFVVVTVVTVLHVTYFPCQDRLVPSFIYSYCHLFNMAEACFGVALACSTAASSNAKGLRGYLSLGIRYMQRS